MILLKAIIFIKAKKQEDKQIQIDACHEYATNNGMQVVGAYDDFNKVIDRVREGGIDKVILTNKDHIGRNSLEYHYVLIYFQREHNVEIIALNEIQFYEKIKAKIDASKNKE